MNATEYLTRLADSQHPPRSPEADDAACSAEFTDRPMNDRDAVDDAVEPFPLQQRDVTWFSLVELILKNPVKLERAIGQRRLQGTLIPRLLMTSLASFVLFGIAMGIVIAASGTSLRLAAMDDVIRNGGPLITFIPAQGNLAQWVTDILPITAAYAFGLIAATGICLPSLYFYCLLAGVRLSMSDIVAHALKAKATSALTLVGILPVYVAMSMGVLIFDLFPEVTLQTTLVLGLCLPFIAGLAGTVSLYRGFAQLTDRLPARCRDSRACFLRRLVASWAACYTVVSPVMIYTVWESLQSLGF